MASDIPSDRDTSLDADLQEARDILRQIETWAVYKLELTGLRLRALLTGQELQEDQFDYSKAQALMEANEYALSIHDIERSAQEWKGCIPADGQEKARILYLLSQSYRFAHKDCPELRKILGLNQDAVIAAFSEQFGQSIESLYAPKSKPDTRPLWFKIPEFLYPDVMKDLRQVLEWVNTPWGETLFREGDESDGLYIMISGRLRIVTEDENGREVILEEVGRGDIFGEISVLSNETRRNASVYAVRDSEMVKMSGEGYKYMATKHPMPAYQFTQQVIEQMRKRLTLAHRSTQFGTLAVVPIHGCPQTKDFIKALVPALQAHGPTLWLNSEIIQSKLGPGIDKLPKEDPASNKLNFWLGSQELANRFLVLEADATHTEWTKRCIKMADRILLVAEAASTPELSSLEKEIYSSEFNKISPSQDLVILYENRAAAPTGTIEWLKRRQVRNHHLVRLDRRGDFQKLGRYLAGKALGVVFSGGSARGLAHVGVYKALQAAGIPCDVVGGTSFGAIIAACIGAGWDAETLDENIHEFVHDSKKHFKITLPVVSIMDGRRLNRLFQHYFGTVNIEDLWTNTFIVSTNLSRSRIETHRSGPLWQAVRASMSIPGVFPPVVEDGELFVDGGVLNYMPSDVMKAHLQGGFVIASDTKIKEGLHRFDYDNDFSPWQVALRGLNPFDSSDKPPNLIEVTALSVGAGEKQREAEELANTDLLIDINTDGFEMFGYDAVDVLIQRGYESAMQKLDTLDKEDLLGDLTA